MSLYYFPPNDNEMEPALSENHTSNLNNKSDISDNMNNNSDNTDSTVTVRTPKYLYCGDGVVECFSEEDIEECVEKKIPDLNNEIDFSQLNWGPWFTHYLKVTGKKVFDVCDTIGEKLAYSLWITSPKYQFEIDEYKRIKEEEKKQEERSKGWIEEKTEVTTKQPAQNQVTPV